MIIIVEKGDILSDIIKFREFREYIIIIIKIVKIIKLENIYIKNQPFT